MGGTRRANANDPSILALLCPFKCHPEVESNREQARKDGWLLRDHQAPECSPMTDVHGRQFLFVDEGRIWL
jgi:hypothetical protein